MSHHGRTIQHLLLAILVASPLTLAEGAEDEDVYRFRHRFRDGKSFTGQFLELKEGIVTIRKKPSGKTFKVNVSEIHMEDVRRFIHRYLVLQETFADIQKAYVMTREGIPKPRGESKEAGTFELTHPAFLENLNKGFFDRHIFVRGRAYSEEMAAKQARAARLEELSIRDREVRRHIIQQQNDLKRDVARIKAIKELLPDFELNLADLKADYDKAAKMHQDLLDNIANAKQESTRTKLKLEYKQRAKPYFAIKKKYDSRNEEHQRFLSELDGLYKNNRERYAAIKKAKTELAANADETKELKAQARKK